MKFIADFHIHSHFSIATSKQLIPEYLDYWAKLKGITVIGTGDFTHPGWIKELKEKLEPAEQGLFKLKKEYIFTKLTKFSKIWEVFLLNKSVSFSLPKSAIFTKKTESPKSSQRDFCSRFETVE